MARGASAAVATENPAQACAGAVLEAVPAAMDALRGTMRRHVGDSFTVPQFRCLNFIAKQPGSSIGAVAAFLGVTMPTASAIVDRLVRAGAVEPRIAATDRRRSHLHLTGLGQEQLQQIHRGARDDLSQALAHLDPGELQALRSGLSILRRAFSQP